MNQPGAGLVDVNGHWDFASAAPPMSGHRAHVERIGNALVNPAPVDVTGTSGVWAETVFLSRVFSSENRGHPPVIEIVIPIPRRGQRWEDTF